MRSADEWFEAYGESHQNPTNKKIHWICIPLIFVSLIALLWEVKLPFHLEGELFSTPLTIWLNLGTLLIVSALSYYALISLPLAIGMGVISALSIWAIFGLTSLGVACGLSLVQLSLLIFILAWIGQFIGHKIEGKKPSFFEDVQFLLIGPLWLLGFIYRRVGISY